VFRVIHLLTIAGLALTIAGASMTGSSNPSTANTAQSLRKAASIIFLLIVLAATALMLRSAGHLSSVHPGDKIIIICALSAAPFLFIRVIYTILISFLNTPTFNIMTPNVYVEAFMQALMEFIAFALFAAAGLFSPSIKSEAYAGQGSTASNGAKYAQGPGRLEAQSNNGYTAPRY
jgi:FtsH-binding integral membrane protein